jgi:hypothetical protein
MRRNFTRSHPYGHGLAGDVVNGEMASFHAIERFVRTLEKGDTMQHSLEFPLTDRDFA